MRFKFDANQPFQVRAISSVVDLLNGQPRIEPDYTLKLGEFIAPVANRLDINETKLLYNLQTVQEGNGLHQADGTPLVDTELQMIEETVRTPRGEEQIRFANFSVEMETGTGKTYVYLRTALELARRYGLRKFIVVVPSVAIREGVLKTLKITENHLKTLYDNIPYRYTVYESRNLSKVRQFAQTDSVEIMVMTIDSFTREENVIRQSTDRLQGATPIHLVQAARPILILDEPQNMESEKRIQALATLNPLFALRYSATHRNPYNLVYQLTPYESYRQGLVKRIEVASVVKEDDFNQVFMRLDDIRSAKNTITAKIAVHQRMAKGNIKEKVFTFRPGDKLSDKAQRSEYEPFQIDEIVPAENVVRFTNNIELQLHQARGAEEEALFREQIRYTIGEHFRKQKKLKEEGLKVLSLFFIDKVENYTGNDALIRKLFDEAFEELKANYPDWQDKKPDDVRSAYFAAKKRRGGVVEFVDSKTGEAAEDREAYRLIMKEKERLLSFREPVSFIFSHSALKEGWDNPNVFQICTLNQTVSEIKKRQEIGRGMRLAVNQKGERIQNEKINVLTVVANESYEDYVRTLQQEMIEEFGEKGAAPRPINAHTKKQVRRRSLDNLPKEFVDLWEKIKHKTRYRVQVDSAKLVQDVVAGINRLHIDPPKIVVTKAAVEVETGKDEYQAKRMTRSVEVANLAGRGRVPNLVDMLAELMEHTTPPVRLTRKTLLEILQKIGNKQAALDNPQDFATKAVQVIKEEVSRQLIDGIQYEKIQRWYEMTQWEELTESASEKVIPATKSIYDYIVYDSTPEKNFAEKLEKRTDVKLYVKLPAWFKVPTPIGNYNPDWALVMEQRDKYGDATGKPLLYLVRETKGTLTLSELREAEQQKIECGKSHFRGALGVDYKVVMDADELP